MRVDRGREVERGIKGMEGGRHRKRKPSGGLMGKERGCRKKETEALRGTAKGREGQSETDKHKETLSDSFYLYIRLKLKSAVISKPCGQLNPAFLLHQSYRECSPHY